MTTTTTPSILTLDALLTHWQGHRGLTRRVIEAFPEGQLFTFSVGGMRPFGELAWEVYGVTGYNLQGLTTDDWSWNPPEAAPPHDRAALLAAWDAQTPQLDAAVPGIDPAWFVVPQTMAWGTMAPLHSVLYGIDNEIHHRAQGYVYLRALGITPPAFYER
ncbi:putative damage-inducible protein DinB [Deinococcus metalli]|uniref:DNA damage-inducible protein DinB n=1 Tax=Deinococcus metalli TaxID=1141878 RepID=A0A7W8NNP3_9DEIO|nr:DinB family protein [Deinococcus metalli]MBB5375981.1 putative damage-inducible protein DinB [Deinococcus metalli]GHF41700.1 DNA damage-inducible protein DinB [Deinococcus metalli]